MESKGPDETVHVQDMGSASCAGSDDPDQSEHPRSPMWAIVVQRSGIYFAHDRRHFIA